MKKVFKKYLWLWEFIGVALILGIGLLVYFKNDILFVIVGLIFAVLGLLRIIPLVKTTQDKLLKWLYSFEVLINIGSGIALIVLGLDTENSVNLKLLFGYLIGGILYFRGVVYFISTVLRHEGTDRTKFISNLVLLTVGALIIGRGGFAVEQLAIVILAIAFLTAIFVAYGGVKNYQNYRNEFAASEMTKKIKKEKGVEAPTSEEIIQDRPVEDPKQKKDELNA
ncbi:MAG: hypothetical protein WCQ80_01515 [Bacilli bacterium]